MRTLAVEKFEFSKLVHQSNPIGSLSKFSFRFFVCRFQRTMTCEHGYQDDLIKPGELTEKKFLKKSKKVYKRFIKFYGKQ